jgi:hypothetical protein
MLAKLKAKQTMREKDAKKRKAETADIYIDELLPLSFFHQKLEDQRKRACCGRGVCFG